MTVVTFVRFTPAARNCSDSKEKAIEINSMAFEIEFRVTNQVEATTFICTADRLKTTSLVLGVKLPVTILIVVL